MGTSRLLARHSLETDLGCFAVLKWLKATIGSFFLKKKIPHDRVLTSSGPCTKLYDSLVGLLLLGLHFVPTQQSEATKLDRKQRTLEPLIGNLLKRRLKKSCFKKLSGIQALIFLRFQRKP